MGRGSRGTSTGREQGGLKPTYVKQAEVEIIEVPELLYPDCDGIYKGGTELAPGIAEIPQVYVSLGRGIQFIEDPPPPGLKGVIRASTFWTATQGANKLWRLYILPFRLLESLLVVVATAGLVLGVFGLAVRTDHGHFMAISGLVLLCLPLPLQLVLRVVATRKFPRMVKRVKELVETVFQSETHNVQEVAMDVVLQLSSQEYAHRLCLYANNRALQAFPLAGAFCEEAEELGPTRSDHRGPCLVLLRRCSASRQEVIRLIETTFLRRYIVRVYWCGLTASSREAMLQVIRAILELRGHPKPGAPEAREIGTIASDSNQAAEVDSLGSAETALTGEGAKDAVLAREPLAIRAHMSLKLKRRVSGNLSSSLWQSFDKHQSSHNQSKVAAKGGKIGRNVMVAREAQAEAVGSIEGGAAEKIQKEQACSAAKDMSRGPSGAMTMPDKASNSLAAATIPTMNDTSGQAVALRLQTYPRDLAEELIDDLHEVDFQPRVFTHTLNIVHTDNMYYYSVTPGEDMWRLPSDRLGMFNGCASSAVCKLEETLAIKGVHLHSGMSVLDVGAAPGAWTEYVASRVKRVAAIDPAELDPRVLLLPNVLHIRKKAEDASEELALWWGDARCDLIICDVNKHPEQAARMLLPLLPHLAKQGLLIVTMKFRGKGRDKGDQVKTLRETLGDLVREADGVWLMANSVYERTFIAVRA